MPQRCSIPLPDIWKDSATKIGLRDDPRGGIVVGDQMAYNSQLNTSNPQGESEDGDGESNISHSWG